MTSSEKLTNQSTASPLVRAAVVHVEFKSKGLEPSTFAFRTPDAKLAEAVNLAQALGVEVVYSSWFQVAQVNPKLYMGGGKAEELAQVVADEEITVVVVNAFLSPSQQRNLEVALKTKVIDRTQLILEIFADRARTKAGKMQVELAQLVYQQSRLVRTWTHLERQRGGLGKTGGPGERQIELDRRMIKDRITLIRHMLKDVARERALHRRARKRAELPVVALVGYTNAGKSTLFNAVVSYGLSKQQQDAFVKDMLFATLDPLMRRIKLPSGREIILSDTVGFVSDLPHELVEAFAATLEEVSLADLLLHVHDASSEDVLAQAEDVREVLHSIGAEGIPVLPVANKADLLPVGEPLVVEGVPVSALEGQGVDELLHAIDSLLGKDESELTFHIPIEDGKALAWLHSHGKVLAQTLSEDGAVWHVRVRLSDKSAAQFGALL